MTQLKKILHIDDDAIMRMMVKKSIERGDQGFEFMSCETSAEFVEQLINFKPDLLIIDVMMPAVHGPALLKQVRDLRNVTPAIFMTGHEKLTLDNKSELDPVLGIIQKPFTPAELGSDLLKLWDAFSK